MRVVGCVCVCLLLVVLPYSCTAMLSYVFSSLMADYLLFKPNAMLIVVLCSTTVVCPFVGAVAAPSLLLRYFIFLL